jgi:hypothetical protein
MWLASKPHPHSSLYNTQAGILTRGHGI